MVADRFVQLDYLTNGRAMLGVGPGALISDATMMGIDPVTQRSRMDEALGVIVRLLDGEVVSHESDWFRLCEARLQLLPINGSMPIAVASTTSPSGMISAGRYGVGVLSLGAGLIGGRKDLSSQWALGQAEAMGPCSAGRLPTPASRSRRQHRGRWCSARTNTVPRDFQMTWWVLSLNRNAWDGTSGA